MSSFIVEEAVIDDDLTGVMIKKYGSCPAWGSTHPKGIAAMKWDRCR